MEPVRSVVPTKVEVSCRVTYTYRMNCFKIVIQDRCNNILYEQQMAGLAETALDPCYTWNTIAALTPPPGALAKPAPPAVPDQREHPPPGLRLLCTMLLELACGRAAAAWLRT